jgi:hypothetical protein
MQYAALVRVRERFGKLHAELDDGRGGKAMVRYCSVQRLSLDIFHRDPGVVVRLANVVDLADVRMVQR